MNIADVSASIIRIAAKIPYRMGPMEDGGDEYFGLVVTVTTDQGVKGHGEVFLTPGWYASDTPMGMIGIVDRTFKPVLKGVCVMDTERVVALMDKAWELGNLFAKSAVEMAVHDAAARSIGRSICDLMGGRVRDRFALSGGVGHDTPDRMAATAKALVDRGFKTIKLKIGAKTDPEFDVIRVRTVREEIGPDIKLRLDGNGVFTVPEAIRLIRKLEPYDLEHVEQPVPGWNVDGMAEIRSKIGAPLMADESVHSVQDAMRVVKAGAADAVKIKIAKTGGYRRSQQIAAVCSSAGVDVLIGQGIGTSLQALAELHFACSHAAVKPAAEFIGSDKLTDDILKTPMVIEDGHAVLPTGAGCGIEVDERKLESLGVSFAAKRAA
ncbi:MAG: enolase C-terminal domain-like protein [Phenylobacterium sp.]|nr:enolase C-terminal domain-like protein [Phenylobacterium sp.]